MTVDEILTADSRFRVSGWGGIAFYAHSAETEADEDTIWSGIEEPTGRVLMVMVGDDRRIPIDPEDVIPLDEADYCSQCGQIGCQADGRD